jgi:hypothetical protein
MALSPVSETLPRQVVPFSVVTALTRSTVTFCLSLSGMMMRPRASSTPPAPFFLSPAVSAYSATAASGAVMTPTPTISRAPCAFFIIASCAGVIASGSCRRRRMWFQSSRSCVTFSPSALKRARRRSRRSSDTVHTSDLVPPSFSRSSLPSSLESTARRREPCCGVGVMMTFSLAASGRFSAAPACAAAPPAAAICKSRHAARARPMLGPVRGPARGPARGPVNRPANRPVNGPVNRPGPRARPAPVGVRPCASCGRGRVKHRIGLSILAPKAERWSPSASRIPSAITPAEMRYSSLAHLGLRLGQVEGVGQKPLNNPV